MTHEEQDKLWAELSEETKNRIRKDYNNSIQNLPIRGEIYSYECLFGEHNLKPSLTYEDVALELVNQESRTLRAMCANEKMLNKLSAIHHLIMVAKFLNKNEDGSDWTPDWENDAEPKWYLCVRHGKKPIPCFTVQNNSCVVYFRTKEIAEQAVQILGEDVVRTALTTEY